MDRVTPSFALYTDLKQFGRITYVDAASQLLSATPVYGGVAPRERVGEKTFLSREVVHAEPGSLPESFFTEFGHSTLNLTARIANNLERGRSRDGGAAFQLMSDHYLGEGAMAMRRALASCGLDEQLYGNAVASVARMRLRREEDRPVVALMLFIATGCLGSPERAIQLTERFMRNTLSTGFSTVDLATANADGIRGVMAADGRGTAAPMAGAVTGAVAAAVTTPGPAPVAAAAAAPAAAPVAAVPVASADDAASPATVAVSEESAPFGAVGAPWMPAAAPAHLGLVRMVNGAMKPTIHNLDASGAETVVGSLATGPNRITDVGQTASRAHLRIWRDQASGLWFVEGLCSTNGTLLRTAAGQVVIVEPPRSRRAGFTERPVEIHPGDFLQLGSDTVFMVLPIAG